MLRLGIAGLGLASTFVLPEFATYAGVRVAAAADLRPVARDRFAAEHGAPTFESVEALCASDAVDAVYISTPPALHAEHVALAAEHHKHAIVEKPMALTLEECDRMNAAVTRNGVHLVVGHTHSFDPPIRKVAEIVRSGALGPLGMLQTWNYTDFMYRPRLDWELDTARGGGVVYAQAPHQVDIIRWIGGGLVHSVRAQTGVWDSTRPTEGAYTAFLELADGTPATAVYSGYAHFDSAELHFQVGERGQHRDPETNQRTREAYEARQAGSASADESAMRDEIRYGGPRQRNPLAPGPDGAPPRQHFFGLTLASCRNGDVRQSPDGLLVYDNRGTREVDLTGEPSGVHAMLDELCEAIAHDRPAPHDGLWATATMEASLAILESARSRSEVQLKRQVPVRAGGPSAAR